VSVDLPARYRSGSISLDGRAGNLSQNGMYFHTSMLDESIENPIHIEIDLPDHDQPLALHGEVRWVQDNGGMGICFTQISLPERRRLANYVILRAYHRPDTQS
jgi:hypothetical protein